MTLTNWLWTWTWTWTARIGVKATEKSTSRVLASTVQFVLFDEKRTWGKRLLDSMLSWNPLITLHTTFYCWREQYHCLPRWMWFCVPEGTSIDPPTQTLVQWRQQLVACSSVTADVISLLLILQSSWHPTGCYTGDTNTCNTYHTKCRCDAHIKLLSQYIYNK